MKYFESFAGVGGIGLGLPKDWELVGVSEVDKFASQVLKYHHPDVKNYGDISAINWKEVPDFDVLTGGSPCQDFSIAGKRHGLAGAKSSLAWEFIRGLRDKQPRYFIWENVKGVMSSRGGWDFANLLSAFSESGYSLWWQVLNAKDFGVPQNRERIFVIGTRADIGDSKEVFFINEGQEESVGEADKQGCANTLTRRSAGGGNRRGNYIHQINQPKHSYNRVYSQEGLSPTLNTMKGGNRQPFITVPEATKKGFTEAEVGDSINLSVMNSKTRRGRVGKGIAQTIDTGAQQYTLTENMEIRRLTPLECERIMGWPDNHTKYGSEGVISDSQRYIMCGNGVVSPIIKELVKHHLP